MFVLMIEKGGYSGARLRPRIRELLRDRPKTLFTKTSWNGENRWHKDTIAYRLYDDKADAQAECDRIAELAQLANLARLADEETDARRFADEAVKGVVALWQTDDAQKGD